MVSFSILILTYNCEPFLDSLFLTIKKNLGEEINNGIAEVILVDNSSSDKTVEKIKKQKYFPARFYPQKINLGYSKGINLAAKNAYGNFLIVINPDAKLSYIDLEKIKNEFEKNEKLAVAGLIIENEKGNKEKNAGKFYNAASILLFLLGLEDLFGVRFSPSNKRKVDYVSGGFVVIRKKFFEKLSGFDEDYFMYVEDMDLCFRAKRAGYEVWFLPYAKIVHKGQGSSDRTFAIKNIFLGFTLFYKKNSSEIMYRYVRSLLSLKARTIIFLGRLLGKKGLVSSYLNASNKLS